jgi:hypothetical protein
VQPHELSESTNFYVDIRYARPGGYENHLQGCGASNNTDLHK